MQLVQKMFRGLSLVFILGISWAYSADYFPAIPGAWWKFDYLFITQHGRGGKELSGTATWTLDRVEGGTIYLDREVSYTQEYTYDRNKSDGSIYNEVTKEIDPPEIVTDVTELEDDGNWIVAAELGEDDCDGLTPWGDEVIAFVHDPDEDEPDPSYLFDVEKITGDERDSVEIRSRTTDNSSQYNKNSSWTIEVTSIEGVGPQSIWRGLGKASRNPIEHQCMDIYELIEYDLGTHIEEGSLQDNGRRFNLDLHIKNNAITVTAPRGSKMPYSATFIDASGREVFDTKNNLSGKTVLKTEKFAVGMYYLKIKSAQGTFVERIPIVR